MVAFRTSHGVLPALDMESLDDMRRVVERTSRVDGVIGFKVGLIATLRLGLKGTAKIFGPRRPLALWLLRRPIAFLRQILA